MASSPAGSDRLLAPDWSSRYAFGLPAGSIRALLALGILGSAAALAALHPDSRIPDAFRDLVFLILGHYFALRKTAYEPMLEGPPPLGLPRGSIRFIIFLVFVAVVVVFLRKHEPLNPQTTPAIYTLIVIAGFLLGVVISRFAGQLWRKGHEPKRIWIDLRAVVALLAAIMLVILAWNESYHFLPLQREGGPKPPITREGVHHVLAAIVAFYYGARS
jgi:hypothetical protein